ncbi:MAG: OadG family transporter subunit [Bacillota bacterium]
MSDMSSISVLDALFIALSGLATVFMMLGSLAILITVISKVVTHLETTAKENAAKKEEAKKEAEPTPAPVVVADAEESDAPIIHETYRGTIKLIDVDERTAVCIMAIISDETGIPLSELIFKKIRAL